jgi:hypothetical protein
VSEGELRAVRAAGSGDAEIIGIARHVALNVWTNYADTAAGTGLDFAILPAAGRAECHATLRARLRTGAGASSREINGCGLCFIVVQTMKLE